MKALPYKNEKKNGWCLLKSTKRAGQNRRSKIGPPRLETVLKHNKAWIWGPLSGPVFGSVFFAKIARQEPEFVRARKTVFHTRRKGYSTNVRTHTGS